MSDRFVSKVIDKNYQSYFSATLQLEKQQPFEPSQICLGIMVLKAQHVKDIIINFKLSKKRIQSVDM